VVRTTTNAAATGHKLSVLLADHLGTANASVDIASGQAVTRRAFKPYGEIRGTKPTNWPNKRSYLGTGIDDEATGLTHIGAREYDQNTGRFLSADPLIDITDPLQMNGYSYAKNSPISTSDPDGLRPITPCDRGCDDGDETFRDWMTQDDDGTWSYHHETTRYVRDGEGDVHSTVKRGSEHRGLGKKTVYKPYDFTAQNTVFNAAVSFFLPDPSDWRNCLSSFEGKSCVVASTDLPWLKVLKLVPDSVIKKGTEAVEDWLSKKPKSCKCFLAGTDVLMADGTTKDIEDVELGDKVLAADPESGESGPREVTRLIVTEEDKHFNELSIATEDGAEKLTATHEHPFWSPSALLWVEARDLKPGMTLLTDEGDTVIITGNRPYTRHARTYNLTVDDLHTYYVLAGQTPVLVHNSSGCPRFVDGDIWDDAFEVSGQTVETMATARISGDTLHLDGFMVFPKGTEGLSRAPVGPDALNQMKHALATRAHAEGFRTVVLNYERHIPKPDGTIFKRPGSMTLDVGKILGGG
jgi:RHS repeat-associated protein